MSTTSFGKRNKRDRKYVAGMLKVTILGTNESFAVNTMRPSGIGFLSSDRKIRSFANALPGSDEFPGR